MFSGIKVDLDIVGSVPLPVLPTNITQPDCKLSVVHVEIEQVL